MALSFRFYSTAAAVTVRHHSGRAYVFSAAGVTDVPVTDAEAIHVPGLVRMFQTGTTADRPKPTPGVMPLRAGTPFYDSSLAAVLFWTGSVWIDQAGNIS
jgi:hypothetical protein